MFEINDLPTELILEIASHFDHSEDTSQASLALTCRQFYEILIHEAIEYHAQRVNKLLKRSLITPHPNMVLSYPNLLSYPTRRTEDVSPLLKKWDRLFSELTIRLPHMSADDVRSVRCLICRSKNLRSVDILVAQLCDLRHLAAIMATCFGKAGLCLTIIGSFSDDQSPFHFTFHSNGHPILPKGKFPETIGTVTTSSKNRDFWHFFRHLLPLTAGTTPSPDSDTKPVSVGTEPSTISVIASQREPRFHISSLPQPELSSLNIDGTIPLLQTLYPITLKALNSPLTSLSLQRISFNLFDWARILPSITLPILKDLTIGDLSISFPDLLSFLERHESIEALILADSNVIGVAKLPARPILPRLKILAANSEYLLPFLQQKVLGYLPELNDIRIKSFETASGPPMALYPYLYDDLYPIYDLLSDERIKDMQITLDSLKPSGLIDWVLYSTENVRESKTIDYLSGVKTLIITCQHLSVSEQSIQKLQELTTADFQFPGEIHDGSQDMFNEFIETFIWTSCAQLRTLKLGSETCLKERPLRGANGLQRAAD